MIFKKILIQFFFMPAPRARENAPKMERKIRNRFLPFSPRTSRNGSGRAKVRIFQREGGCIA